MEDYKDKLWYSPNATRESATLLLQPAESGSFLVRKSSQPSCLALSYKEGDGERGSVEHVLIRVLDGQGYAIDTNGTVFSSIPEILRSLQQKSSAAAKRASSHNQTAVEALAEMFPEHSDRQLRRAIKEARGDKEGAVELLLGTEPDRSVRVERSQSSSSSVKEVEQAVYMPNFVESESEVPLARESSAVLRVYDDGGHEILVRADAQLRADELAFGLRRWYIEQNRDELDGSVPAEHVHLQVREVYEGVADRAVLRDNEVLVDYFNKWLAAGKLGNNESTHIRVELSHSSAKRKEAARIDAAFADVDGLDSFFADASAPPVSKAGSRDLIDLVHW